MKKKLKSTYFDFLASHYILLNKNDDYLEFSKYLDRVIWPMSVTRDVDHVRITMAKMNRDEYVRAGGIEDISSKPITYFEVLVGLVYPYTFPGYMHRLNFEDGLECSTYVFKIILDELMDAIDGCDELDKRAALRDFAAGKHGPFLKRYKKIGKNIEAFYSEVGDIRVGREKPYNVSVPYKMMSLNSQLRFFLHNKGIYTLSEYERADILNSYISSKGILPECMEVFYV